MKKIMIVLGIGVVLVIATFLLFNFEKNDDKILKDVKPFKISKISVYCGASGEKKSDNYQNPEWNLNIYQYADIAIRLERVVDYSKSNNIKTFCIENIRLNSPKLGTPGLYYLNPYNYGTDDIPYTDVINGSLEFNIVNSENENNDMNYSIPIVFQDFSNPITLKYVNKEILTNYKIDNSEKLIFNGEILKRAKVNPEDIKNTISFRINIETSADENIFLDVNVPILQKGDNGDSLYNGNITYDIDEKNI